MQSDPYARPKRLFLRTQWGGTTTAPVTVIRHHLGASPITLIGRRAIQPESDRTPCLVSRRHP